MAVRSFMTPSTSSTVTRRIRLTRSQRCRQRKRPPSETRPFVGRSAFAHKAGMHVDAITKNPVTFEHIDPRRVGNMRRILVSELSGSSTVEAKAREYGLDLTRRAPETRELLDH